MFGKAPLTSREAMMRSIGSMSATVSWRKMWGAAWDGPPEAGWYVGVQVGADAA